MAEPEPISNNNLTGLTGVDAANLQENRLDSDIKPARSTTPLVPLTPRSRISPVVEVDPVVETETVETVVEEDETVEIDETEEPITHIEEPEFIQSVNSPRVEIEALLSELTSTQPAIPAQPTINNNSRISMTLPNVNRGRTTRLRPESPRDATPIIADGVMINRSDLPPINLPAPVNTPAQPLERSALRKRVLTPLAVPNIPPLHPVPHVVSPRDAVPILPAQLMHTPSNDMITQIGSIRAISPRVTHELPVSDDPPIQNFGAYTGFTSPAPTNNNNTMRSPAIRFNMPVPAKLAPVTVSHTEDIQPLQVIQPTEPQVKPKAKGKSRRKPVEDIEDEEEESEEEKPKPKPRRRRVKPKPKLLEPAPRPNYSVMTSEEQAGYWADFRMNFGKIKEAYPTYGIPEVDTFPNLDIAHSHYERYVKQMHIDNTANGYKVYLIILYGCIELFCRKILHLDLEGYTFEQLQMTKKYETLLLELGEKSFSSIGSSWPVEARIVMLAVFNAAIFLIIKLFSAYLGEGLGGIIRSMVTQLMSGNNQPVIAKAMPTAANGLPEVPSTAGPSVGGFNLNSLLSAVGGLFGGGGNNNGNGGAAGGEHANRPKASRRPAFVE